MQYQQFNCQENKTIIKQSIMLGYSISPKRELGVPLLSPISPDFHKELLIKNQKTGRNYQINWASLAVVL